jgi:hypothetical protein
MVNIIDLPRPSMREGAGKRKSGTIGPDGKKIYVWSGAEDLLGTRLNTLIETH